MFNETQVMEKRRFSRVGFKQQVDYRFNDPRLFGGTLSCDLSEGGIRVKARDFVTTGTPVTVTIHLPTGEVAECAARVMWAVKERFSDRYELGLEFEDTDSLPDSRARIHRFMVRRHLLAVHE